MVNRKVLVKSCNVKSRKDITEIKRGVQTPVIKRLKLKKKNMEKLFPNN